MISQPAARGTQLTILMMLAEAINNAVTEQWLDFEDNGGDGSGRGIQGSSSNIYCESVCYALPSKQTCTAMPEEKEEGPYLGVDTKTSQ